MTTRIRGRRSAFVLRLVWFPPMRGVAVLCVAFLAAGCGGRANGSLGAATGGSGLDEDATAPPWKDGMTGATDAGTNVCTVCPGSCKGYGADATPCGDAAAESDGGSHADAGPDGGYDPIPGPPPCPPGQRFCFGCSGPLFCLPDSESCPADPCASIDDAGMPLGDADAEELDAGCPAGEVLCDVGCGPYGPRCAQVADPGLCPPAPPCP